MQVDLIVHEILGEIASIEGVSGVVRDAQKRHLASFPSELRTSVSKNIGPGLHRDLGEVTAIEGVSS